MKLSKKLTIAIVLLIEILDKKITDKRIKSYNEYIERKRTQKPLEQPKMNSPSKYHRQSINANTGIITSTTATSKYTTEQLQDMYKENPYTNSPYKI